MQLVQSTQQSWIWENILTMGHSYIAQLSHDLCRILEQILTTCHTWLRIEQCLGFGDLA